MSENNKNLHQGTDSHDYSNLENFFNEAPIADSMKSFEIPMHSFNVDFNHDDSESQMDVDYSTAFTNYLFKIADSVEKVLSNPNCAIPELSEFSDCINSSVAPLNEAEDILTPLFQSKAKELCPSDNMLAALTMNEVIHLIAGDLYCDGDCDDCNRCDDSNCCDGGDDSDDNRCDDCDCCNDDCDCCNDNCRKDDCDCAKENSDDGGIIDPDAPLDVKASIVCSSLFGEYDTYEQLPDEMKKAVDLTREAYAILVGESLDKLHSLLLHHFNDLPTPLVPDFFSEISDRALYVLTFLDIIDPDHRTNNFPEDSGDCSEDAPEVATSEE